MQKRYTLIAALLLSGGMAIAQSGYTGRASVTQSVEKSGPDIRVRLDIGLDGVELKSQHALVLTPVLQSRDGSMRKELSPVVVNGRVRQKACLRDLSLNGDSRGYHDVVRRRNGSPQLVSYEFSLPYEKWMRGAFLMLREEVSGCAVCELGEDTRTLGTILPLRTIKEPVYVSAFSVPRTEEVKRRDEQCELHLSYASGNAAVNTSLGDNKAEIQKLQDMVDRVKADNDLTLTGFRVNGYASPEGSFKSNMILSERRSKALAEYFRRTNGWKPDLFKTTWSGEDWKGLEKAVESSSLATKDKVLSIIKEEKDPDARDTRIRSIDNGVTYNTLLKDFYPPLRRSFCVVDFTVRPYTLEEAKRIIKEKPKLLSLKEMYEVAGSYPKGSAESVEAFLTAQRLYPKDADAVTNAAAVLLEQGKYSEAKAMLEGVEQTGTVCNALGIVYAKERSYDKAAACFAQGAGKGCKEAADNGKALKKFIEELDENNY